jgi:hypothetical protein
MQPYLALLQQFASSPLFFAAVLAFVGNLTTAVVVVYLTRRVNRIEKVTSSTNEIARETHAMVRKNGNGGQDAGT